MRVGLRALLDPDPEFKVVGETTSKQEALINIPRLKPEIVILDLRLQDGSGMDAARELLTMFAKLRILLLFNGLEDEHSWPRWHQAPTAMSSETQELKQYCKHSGQSLGVNHFLIHASHTIRLPISGNWPIAPLTPSDCHCLPRNNDCFH